MTEGRRSADERVILVQPDHNADDIARVETLRRLGPRRVPKGRGSKDGLRQNRKAVTLEYRFGLRRSQKCQILDRPWLGVYGRRHGIDDRIVGIVGKDADNFHSRFYVRVCLIDDAERRFAARDQTKG